MSTFDGADIFDGDKLWVVGMGPATVIDVNYSGFRIRVAGRTRKVNYQGIQSGDQYKTVFWKDPVLAIPSKNNALWSQQKKLALTAVNALGAAVVGQELVREIETPAEGTVATAESNDAALQRIVQQAQADEAARQVRDGEAARANSVTPIRPAG